MNWEWISTTGSSLVMVALSAVAIYATLLLCTRVAGLRSFSQISGFDFPITVAMGTLVASTMLLEDPPLLRSIAALGILFGIQFLVSKLRRHTTILPRMVDNRPVLLMAGNEIIHENLDAARISDSDLNSKLRTAGVSHPDQVFAVVMETTGDVSVIKRNGNQLDPAIFEGVRGADRLHAVADEVNRRS